LWLLKKASFVCWHSLGLSKLYNATGVQLTAFTENIGRLLNAQMRSIQFMFLPFAIFVRIGVAVCESNFAIFFILSLLRSVPRNPKAMKIFAAGMAITFFFPCVVRHFINPKCLRLLS
jgi:hypothetical protein